MKLTTVKCPTCQKPVEWTDDSPWRPFCSERCKLIDLGAWADESHRIPEATPPDFAEHPGDPDDQRH
jgi:endogenous inhibitor of DNA gyrase (YacG/DUF329 family)